MPVTIRARYQRHAAGTTVSGTTHVTAELSRDEHRAFVALAKARKMSRAALVRELIQQHLAAQGR